MTRDIEISDNGLNVVFHKQLWNDAEVVLAKCFCFLIDIESGCITASIQHTSKEALFSFIRVSFKNFNESPSEIGRREAFYTQIESLYSNIDAHVEGVINSNLPYANKFYRHQREGIRFAFFNKASFLAFTMRLGKSLIAASISRIFNIRTTLIVCPSVAKMGWFKDLTDNWGFDALWFSLLDASKTRSFQGFDERFIIVNYDTLPKWMSYILNANIGHIIIDEAHRIKNRNSNRYGMMEKIVDQFPNAKITFISGTAIPNRFNDLFAYFKLTKHHLGDNYKKFCDTFTITSAGRGGDRVTGAKNIADLKMKMQNFMLVRTMEDCFDMPEDVVSKITFEFDDYKAEYDKIIKEMSEQKSISALNSSIHSLNIITSKSKIKGTIELIEEIVEENGKVVVFGSYKEPLHELQAHFKERCVMVDGSINSNEKYRLRTLFHEDPSVQIFLGNYLAAGEALDLSISSDVVTLNFPFTPREIQQALFRCKHPEKMKHLRIHFTFCQGSLDEHLYNLVADKTRDINALLHDGKEVVEMENLTEVLIKKLLNRDDIIFESPFRKAKGLVEGEEVQEITESENEQGGLQESVSSDSGGSISGTRSDNNGQIASEEPGIITSGNTEPDKTSAGLARNTYAQYAGISEKDGRTEEPNMLGQKGPGYTANRYYLMVNTQKAEMFICDDSTYTSHLRSGECQESFSHDIYEEVLKRGRHKQMHYSGKVNLDKPKAGVLDQIKEVFVDLNIQQNRALNAVNSFDEKVNSFGFQKPAF